MNNLFNLVVYMGIGGVGGFLASKTKLPAGTLLGAFVAVILFKMVTQTSWPIPKRYGFVCQIFLGVLIASTYQPGMYKHIGTLAYPLVGSTLALVFVGLLTAFILSHLRMLDFPTAYIATSPGAISALVPLAIEVNADAALIAHFHFFRIIFVALTAPFLFKYCFI